MISMKPFIPRMRDKAMAYGMHTYGISGNQLKNRLYYSGYGTSIYTVELFFDSILMLHFADAKIVRDSLDIYLSYEQNDGFLPRALPIDERVAAQNPFYPYESEEHAQPFLGQLTLLTARMDGGADWLSRENYERLQKYLAHWTTYWTRGEGGLCVWNSAPHGCSDTAFSRAGSWRSMYCAAVNLNASLYAEYLAMSKLALALGRGEDAKAYEGLANAQLACVRAQLWDEEDGLYYDLDVRTGRHIKVKHCHLFDAMTHDVATREQAARMVAEHLLNPSEFWTEYPIPSYALSEPDYTQFYRPPAGSDFLHFLGEGHCNWCGGLWPHAEYMLAHALKRYGFGEPLERLVSQCEKMVARNPLLHEWYNPETGEGMGGSPFFAGVEMLLCFLRAELEAGFDPFVVAGVDEPLPLDAIRAALDIQVIEQDR